MALNIKILFPLDHPEVSFPNKKNMGGPKLNLGFFDLAKDNLSHSHLKEELKRQIYDPKEKDLKQKINII